jgi:glycosyltransferase involved in cell wall biosynthesis
VNRNVNYSRAGVVCSTLDAAPRVILEYMAADVPVVVNAGLRAGCRYVSPDSGVLASAEVFPEAIVDVLERTAEFSPRAHVLDHFSRELVVGKLAELLQGASCHRAATATAAKSL